MTPRTAFPARSLVVLPVFLRPIWPGWSWPRRIRPGSVALGSSLLWLIVVCAISLVAPAEAQHGGGGGHGGGGHFGGGHYGGHSGGHHAGRHFGWLHFGFARHLGRKAGSGTPSGSDSYQPSRPLELRHIGARGIGLADAGNDTMVAATVAAWSRRPDFFRCYPTASGTRISVSAPSAVSSFRMFLQRSDPGLLLRAIRVAALPRR
jgi:hypothetical protein